MKYAVYLFAFICLISCPAHATQDPAPAANMDQNATQDPFFDRRLRRGLLMVREDEDVRLDSIEQGSIEDHLNDLKQKYAETLKKENAAKAYFYLYEMSSLGYVPAQEALALSYYNGNGVERDYAKAFHWFTQAANRGKPLSMHYIASMYLNGLAKEPDPVKAYQWFSLAETFYKDDEKKERAKQDRINTGLRLSEKAQRKAEENARLWILEFDRKNVNAATPPKDALE